MLAKAILTGIFILSKQPKCIQRMHKALFNSLTTIDARVRQLLIDISFTIDARGRQRNERVKSRRIEACEGAILI